MLSPVMKTIINDIDLGGLEDLAESAEASPEQATLGFQVVTRWDGQFRSETMATKLPAAMSSRRTSRKSCSGATRPPIPRSC